MLKLLRRIYSFFRRRKTTPTIILKPPHFSNNTPKHLTPKKSIKLATFNAALFSMAPATATPLDKSYPKPFNNNPPHPKSILKQSPLHHNSPKSSSNSRRVSINLPDNEISLGRSSKSSLTKTVSRSVSCLRSSNRAVVDVLRELDADILALQEVKADEEKEMKPLSELAAALGMHYVFAESWAPEFGNAVLSKWPIIKCKVHKIFDHSDFRNVLKTTIDVPGVGEINFCCTLLDHLDENWRMKQINAIIRSTDHEPHILAGGLNSLDESDYSHDRWTDIVKYYEEIGKPIPKTEVMKFLKDKKYTDAKGFAGECESVVVIAKGQSVQGTCKYGTRLDYILASPGLQYKFVPGSYSVFSSKGTSDHHIVTVDILKAETVPEIVIKEKHQPRKRVVRITDSSTRGIWSTDMR